jgi:hypothetical protein
MKISLALGPRERLSRETAWGCFTSNLALPGLGSLMAGRAVGYAQMVLAVGGLGLTLILGLRFLAWYLMNNARLRGTQDDPWATLLEVWHALRWPVVGMSVFVLGLLWALWTSVQVLQAAKREPPTVPPKLD